MNCPDPVKPGRAARREGGAGRSWARKESHGF